jgi:hypothetical protein
MATLNEVLFGLKNIISGEEFKKLNNITDTLLMFYINNERANLFNKVQDVSEIFYQTLENIPINFVEKEKYLISDEIPSLMAANTPSKEKVLISEIYSNGGTKFPLVSYRQAQYIKSNRFTKNKPVAFYRDNRIYLYNVDYYSSGIKKINVDAIFGNPLDVAVFNDPNFNFTIDDIKFPFPDKYITFAYNNIINYYFKPTIGFSQDSNVTKNET